MVELKVLECAKCGGPLSVGVGQREITCPYCGTKKLVQQTNEAPRAPAPVEHSPTPAVTVPRKPLLAGVLVSFVLTTGIAAAVFFQLRGAVEGVSGGAGLAEKLAGVVADDGPRFRGQPLLGEVNGDGVVDVVAECDSRTATKSGICAFDGRDGKLLWWKEIPKETLGGSAMQGLVSGLLVTVDPLGKLQSYKLADGSPLWAGLVSDRARQLCEREGNVVVTAADGERYSFSATTGQKTSLGKVKRTRGPETECDPVWAARSETNPAQTILGWSDFEEYGLPPMRAVEGLRAHRALVPSKGDLAFFLGGKAEGTQVPMVAAVRNRKVVWTAVTPGIDPLLTKVNVTTQLAAYGGGVLVVPYDLREMNGTRMAAFRGETGERLWDVEIHKDSQVSAGIAITDEAVYYATWTELHVLALGTGETKFRIGTKLSGR